jgi:hypothetical protein
MGGLSSLPQVGWLGAPLSSRRWMGKGVDEQLDTVETLA